MKKAISEKQRCYENTIKRLTNEVQVYEEHVARKGNPNVEYDRVALELARVALRAVRAHMKAKRAEKRP